MNSQISVIPSADSNGFVKTLNNFGYMTSYLDDTMKAFVQFSTTCTLPVLDVGAAYGVATIPAIKEGAQVIANDLDKRHLLAIESALDENEKVRLTKLQGQFPDLQIKENSIQGVLIARVLHFFTGIELETSAQLLRKWLVPGGKVFITAETPYLGNWLKFIPVYEQRLTQKDEWPGLVTGVAKYISTRGVDLPDFMHLLDPNVLTRVFENAGFVIEEAKTFARPEFPKDMQLDGRESVSFIAQVKK